ncbi:hypothetical protein KI387_021937, partial [Taxus chinensis]
DVLLGCWRFLPTCASKGILVGLSMGDLPSFLEWASLTQRSFRPSSGNYLWSSVTSTFWELWSLLGIHSN